MFLIIYAKIQQQIFQGQFSAIKVRRSVIFIFIPKYNNRFSSAISSCYLCFLFLEPFLDVTLFLFFFKLFLLSVAISSITGFTCPLTVLEITKFSSVTCPQSISCLWISSESTFSLSSLSSLDPLFSSSPVSINAKLCTGKQK